MNASALYLPARLAEALLEQARAEHPRECLGLLFGGGGQVRRLQPLTNVSPAPQQRFLAAPEALLRALTEADSHGEDLLALYHSHPRGPDTPSRTDFAEMRYHVPMIIIVPGPAILRAFDLTATTLDRATLDRATLDRAASERDLIVTVAPG